MSETHESVAPAAQPLNTLEAEAIATLGYIYGYPLVLMDATRAVSTPPVNRFKHVTEFPDDTFTDVVSPNVDTLYSIAWLDLGKEPIVLGVPDLGRRYYTMELLDAWTNVIASPGTRTTGNGKGAFALVGPGWRGELPSSVEAIQAPTSAMNCGCRALWSPTSMPRSVRRLARIWIMLPGPLGFSDSLYWEIAPPMVMRPLMFRESMAASRCSPPTLSK